MRIEIASLLSRRTGTHLVSAFAVISHANLDRLLGTAHMHKIPDGEALVLVSPCNCPIEENLILMRLGANLGATLAPRVAAVPAAREHGHNTFNSAVRHNWQLIDVFAPHGLQEIQVHGLQF